MTQSTVNTLHGACYMYRGDFGDFPTSSGTIYGPEYLTLLLTGYADNPGTKGLPSADPNLDDGCDGPGFRTVYRGKVYGPYGGTERMARSTDNYGRPVFIDAFKQMIYYYKYDRAILKFNMNDGNTVKLPNAAVCGIGDSEYFKNYAATSAQDPPFYRYDFVLATPGADRAWWAGPNFTPGASATFDVITSSDDITNMLLEGPGHTYTDIQHEAGKTVNQWK